MEITVIFIPHGVIVRKSSDLGVKCPILSLAHSKSSVNGNNDNDDNDDRWLHSSILRNLNEKKEPTFPAPFWSVIIQT